MDRGIKPIFFSKENNTHSYSWAKQELYCPLRRLKHFCSLHLWYNKSRKWRHSDWAGLRRWIQLSLAQLARGTFCRKHSLRQQIGFSAPALDRGSWFTPCCHPDPPCHCWAGCPAHNPAPGQLPAQAGLSQTPPAFVTRTPTNGFLLWQ